MVTLHLNCTNGSFCQTGDEQYLLRIFLGSFAQLGCKRPPFTQKSTCPTCGTSPRKPAFVWITCTIVASSLVNRNSAEPYLSTNGLAGSRPVNHDGRDVQSRYVSLQYRSYISFMTISKVVLHRIGENVFCFDLSFCSVPYEKKIALNVVVKQ